MSPNTSTEQNQNLTGAPSPEELEAAQAANEADALNALPALEAELAALKAKNTELADSVNHLLVVGFYLINIGFVSLYLKTTENVTGAQGVFETLSGKMGVVLLVLGGMHFFNLLLFTKLRKRAHLATMPPPVPPMLRVSA